MTHDVRLARGATRPACLMRGPRGVGAAAPVPPNHDQGRTWQLAGRYRTSWNWARCQARSRQPACIPANSFGNGS
jgi:hypothetical protein